MNKVIPIKRGDPMYALFRYGKIVLTSSYSPRIFYSVEHYNDTRRRYNGTYLPTDELVKYVPEKQWIPVTERLPEESKFVLCFYPEKDYGSKTVVDYREYQSYGFSEEFQFGRPSHWMPLPEPPEAEKGR